MSTADSDQPVIVKRRPTRESFTEEVSNPEPVEVEDQSQSQSQSQSGVQYHSDSESEEDADQPEPEPRKTRTPGDATQYSRPEEIEEDGEAEDPTEEEAAAEEAVTAADTAEPIGQAPPVVSTARPGQSKQQRYPLRNEVSREASTVPKAPVKKTTTTTTTVKKVPPVSISNVERKRPIAAGVNTPRSIRACEKCGINPAELAPYPLEHFKGPRVPENLAVIRFRSYDKRRRAHMETLAPVYASLTPQASSKVTSVAPSVQRESESRSAMNEEDRENQKRFDDYIKRQNAQKGGASKTGTPRYSVRASTNRGYSPRSGGASAYGSVGRRSSAVYTQSVAKIESRFLAEGRPPTVSEQIMLAEIEEREMRRLEAKERAELQEESKQIIMVEETLEKEKRSSDATRKRYQEMEAKREALYKKTNERQIEAERRRAQLEKERKERLKQVIAEKEQRVPEPDPYASFLARRRSSAAPYTGRSSGSTTGRKAPQRHADPVAEPVEESQLQEDEL